MNNDIKIVTIGDIFENLQTEEKALKFLAYIIYLQRLQEENERLSVELNQNMIERNNYLSRNEKAIEYIKIAKTNEENDNMKDYIYTKEDLLNILQGENDDRRNME